MPGWPGDHGPPGPPGPEGPPGPPGPSSHNAEGRNQLGPFFKEELKASDFPSFDGQAASFEAWLEEGNWLYAYGYSHPHLTDALGYVATFNFKD